MDESDEFYDSLEEEELEHNYVKTIPAKKDDPYTDSLEDELDDVIPFYDGNLSLSIINSSGQSSKCEFLANKSKSKIQSLSNKQEKTYLNLFYERSGEKCSKSNTRVLQNYGDSKTDTYTPSLKSITTYGDTQIIDDDVDSMYLRSNISESEISCNYEKINSMMVPELHLNSNGSLKYQSLSDVNFDSYKSPQLIVCKKNRSIFKTNNNNFGTVGSVPVNDKLESWKRRQQYGRKVSESNRIKMNERRILRNLERELQNSKICV